MFLFAFDDFFLELDELTPLCNFDQLGTLYEVHPPRFCRFFLGLFGLVAFLLFFLLLLGGFPLPSFPCVFPCFLGGWGLRFLFLWLCTLASLHLLCRSRIGQDGLPTRKPPGPHRACTLLVSPDPSPAGSRRGDEQSTSAVG